MENGLGTLTAEEIDLVKGARAKKSGAQNDAERATYEREQRVKDIMGKPVGSITAEDRVFLNQSIKDFLASDEHFGAGVR